MFKYVLKRIFIFIPTLIIISLAIFALSKIAPGDPVEIRLGGGMGAAQGQLADKLAGEQAYFDMAKSMGLDLPNFYFSLTSKAYPDSLYRIGRRYEENTLNELCHKYGNWGEISKYYKAVKNMEIATYKIERTDETYSRLRSIREVSNELLRTSDSEIMENRLAKIMEDANKIEAVQRIDTLTGDTTQVQQNLLTALLPEANALKASFDNVKNNKSTFKRYIPRIAWYGSQNQYHRWVFGDVPWFKKNDDPSKQSRGILRGDFGLSYLDGRPVMKIIKEGVSITFVMNLIAIFLVYFMAIPLGVYIAVKKDSLFDRVSTISTFILFSLPTFWIGTMLIVFFTNPEYGMSWFPAGGLGKVEGLPFFSKLGIRLHHLILPIFCMVYGGLAFLSRQMRGGILGTIKQDFIRTARAKGLSENVILWKHTFRNSLIPLITMFASLFPAMIGGSLVIEIIFSIPGMGRIAFESIIARNYPVLFTVLLFSAVLTLVGLLIADIVYGLVDPRISFTKKAS